MHLKHSYHFHLNGGAADTLRNLVPRQEIRGSGAFFTGEKLGRTLVNRVEDVKKNHSAAWDPTCGAGDLLLRWSEKLSVSTDLESTLHSWGNNLSGVDLHPEFIAVTKRRLILSAVNRGAKLRKGKLKDSDAWFPQIRQGNMLDQKNLAPAGAVILMNPPFTMMKTPNDCRGWASGQVSFAAVSVIKSLDDAREGQRILAILPDVLRSGSRYKAWRELIAQRLRFTNIDLVGKFSPHADVDVFILDGIVGTPPRPINWQTGGAKIANRTLESIFQVSVGSVVPHRHLPSGKSMRYLCTSEAKPWSELSSIKARLVYNGTTVEGPFVAVRRTSSPSDSSRAIATVVNLPQPIAVENHLIAIRPLDGSVEKCRRLSAFLHSNTAREWLDRRIRCRHLTVGAMRQMPIPEDL